MPGSFCTVCHRRIPKGSRCARHAIKSPSNRAWHQPGSADLRRRALERAQHRCERCSSTQDLEVHHVIPIGEGGSHAVENTEVLCRDCHRSAHA